MGIERISTESITPFRAVQTDWELARKIADSNRPQQAEGQNPSLSGELSDVDILSPEGRESYARVAMLSRQVSRRLQEEAEAALRREEAAQHAEEQRQEREERARQAADDEARRQERGEAADASGEDREADRLPGIAAHAAQAAYGEEDGKSGTESGPQAARSDSPSEAAAASQADGETGRQAPLHLVV